MKQERLKIVTNAVLGQALWFVCVLGGRSGMDGVAAAAVAAAICLQSVFLWGHSSGTVLLWASIVAVHGIAMDSLLIGAGLLDAARSWPSAPWIPLWLAALWFAFAQMVPVALRWLTKRPQLAVLLGAIGGPMAYMGGRNLGAVSFPAGTWPTMVVLGLVWAWHFWFAFCGVPAWLNGIDHETDMQETAA